MSTQEKGRASQRGRYQPTKARHTPRGWDDTGATYPLRDDVFSSKWYTYVDYHHEGYLNEVGTNLLRDIVAYIDYGRERGGFLTSIFSNDLMNTVGKADGHCDMEFLHNIVRWLYNVPPASAWGSKAAVNRWVKSRGLHGQWQETNKEFLKQLYKRRSNNE